MYIKSVHKKNGVTNKDYAYLHLVETIRTPSGPRQRLILNLGNIDVHPSQFKSLAKRIEDLLTGQKSFVQIDEKINKYAKQAADKLFEKQSQVDHEQQAPEHQMVDLNSLTAENARSFGPEYAGHSIWEELKMNDFLTQNNVPASILPVIESVILGRLIEPGSELHTKQWVENRSALFELCGSPLRHALNSYYRASDRLYELKEELETYLAKVEKNIFDLKETYFFFDLTNTYFEGQYKGSIKSKYGRSKEKRSDCKIITLGLVVDEQGFAKCSSLFPGNLNDSKSLSEMINNLEEKTHSNCEKKTIVMDAGVATEDNLTYLKSKNYHYIVVGRTKPPVDLDEEDIEIIKEDASAGIKIEVKRFTKDEETMLLCKSALKQKKEQSMHDRIEVLLIDRLNYYKTGLDLPKRMKKYEKVLEAIGRLKEKYSKVAKLYNITVIPESDQTVHAGQLEAVDIVWEKKDNVYDEEVKNEGCYVLRTDLTNLSNKEIWETYNMLRRIEYSFLCMKSHLGLRPNFHTKEERVDTHMFISVIAYHFLQIIEHRLRQQGDNRKWSTVRDILKTHQRLTISMNIKAKVNKRQQIRLNTKLEPEHESIYRKLGIANSGLRKTIERQV